MKNKGLLCKGITHGLILCVMVFMVTFGRAQEIKGATTEAPPAKTTTPAEKTKLSEPQHGGTLRIGYYVDAFNPGYPPDIRQSQDYLLGRPAIESLGRFDKTGMLQPWLATGWQTDARAKTMTLTLRKGVKFHDGTDFNATACKWNLDRFRNAGREEVKSVASIDIIDDYTVRLNLSIWDNTIVNAVCYFGGPMISPAAFQTYGKDWCASHPIGTGPFQFVSWEKEVAMKYKKFDGYWQKGKPYLDAIEFRIITDSRTALFAFKAGEIDLIAALETSYIPELEKAGNYTVIKFKEGMGSTLYGVIGDSIHPDSPFSDLRVRQAVGYAIDTQAIADILFHGTAILTNQWTVPSNWAYNPNIKGYPYNPTKAKELLTAAGYSKGFKITLYGNNSTPFMNIMTAIQAYLAKVGIDAQIEAESTAAWMTRIMVAANPGYWKNGLNILLARPDSDVVLQMPRAISANALFNAKSIIHPDKVEKLLIEARSALDFQTKKTKTHELQQAVFDEYVIFTPLFVTGPAIVKYPKVHDDSMPALINTEWTPENTWIEK